MPQIPVEQYGTLWVAHVPTTYGRMELLCGEGDAPDKDVLALVTRFLEGETDHIGATRKDVFRTPILWRPIRFAVNNEGRLGLQFKHRITGRQDGMYFADEHSSFKSRLTDVSANEKSNPHG